MYSNVILIRVEGTEKRLRIVDNIDANEEMCRLQIVRLKEGIQRF